MVIPEYLSIFSGHGPIKIQVKFKGFDGSVRVEMMQAQEIEKIVSFESETFLKHMLFDESLFEIYKYEIDPINGVMTIRTRPSTHPHINY